MKAFIEKVFKMKKQKELLDEIANTENTEESTEIIEENKKIIAEQIKESVKTYKEKLEQHTDTKDD